MYSCDGKAEFSASLLQSPVTWSFRDLDLKKYSLSSMLKTVVLHNMETMNFFRILWWIETSKEQHLFEIEMFCNIISLLSLLINLMHPWWIKVFISYKIIFTDQTFERWSTLITFNIKYSISFFTNHSDVQFVITFFPKNYHFGAFLPLRQIAWEETGSGKDLNLGLKLGSLSAN